VLPPARRRATLLPVRSYQGDSPLDVVCAGFVIWDDAIDKEPPRCYELTMQVELSATAAE